MRIEKSKGDFPHGVAAACRPHLGVEVFCASSRLWTSLLGAFMLYCWQLSISLCRVAFLLATQQEGKESLCALSPS